ADAILEGRQLAEQKEAEEAALAAEQAKVSGVTIEIAPRQQRERGVGRERGAGRERGERGGRGRGDRDRTRGAGRGARRTAAGAARHPGLKAATPRRGWLPRRGRQKSPPPRRRWLRRLRPRLRQWMIKPPLRMRTRRNPRGTPAIRFVSIRTFIAFRRRSHC